MTTLQYPGPSRNRDRFHPLAVYGLTRKPEINFSKAVLGATIALIGLVLLLIAYATAAWAQVDQGNGLSDPEQYRTALVFILGIAAWAYAYHRK